MTLGLLILLAVLGQQPPIQWQQAPTDSKNFDESAKNFFEFTQPSLNTTPIFFRNFIDHICVVVIFDKPNKELRRLQQLEDKYRKRNFKVLAMPMPSATASQPLKLEKELREKWKLHYSLLAPANLSPGENPLIDFLTTKGEPKDRGPLKEPYTKFVINRKGQVIGRFSGATMKAFEKFIAAQAKSIN